MHHLRAGQLPRLQAQLKAVEKVGGGRPVLMMRFRCKGKLVERQRSARRPHFPLPNNLPPCRQQASAAALAQVYWQPVAVQQAHGQGVAAVQQPLDVSGLLYRLCRMRFFVAAGRWQPHCAAVAAFCSLFF